jgi:hypothetical protein
MANPGPDILTPFSSSQLTNIASAGAVRIGEEWRGTGHRDVLPENARHPFIPNFCFTRKLRGTRIRVRIRARARSRHGRLTMLMMKILGVTTSARFSYDQGIDLRASIFGKGDRPYFLSFIPGEKRAKDAEIKLTNSNNDSSMFENRHRQSLWPWTRDHNARRPSHVFVVRTSWRGSRCQMQVRVPRSSVQAMRRATESQQSWRCSMSSIGRITSPPAKQAGR